MLCWELKRLVLGAVLVICLVCLTACQRETGPVQQEPTEVPQADMEVPASRPFFMGFAYQPHDWSEAAFEEAFRLLDQHSDIILITFDGALPWQECLDKAPYPPVFEAELQKLQKGLPVGPKRILALNLLAADRVNLALNQGNEQQARTGAWAERSFDDPAVQEAYLNWCRDMIARFEPDYVCYVMEVDAGLMDADEPRFQALKSLLSSVYKTLKAEYPQKTIFLEFMLENDEEMEKRQRATSELLDYTDLFAVSTYPFVAVGGDPGDLPSNWFERASQIAPEKPFAVMETNWLAENFYHPTQGIPDPRNGQRILIFGKETWQSEYIELLFKEARKMEAEFVVQWNVRDLDQLHVLLDKGGGRMDSKMNPFWKLAQDCGLYDQDGRARPSLQVWEAWRKQPRQRL